MDNFVLNVKTELENASSTPLGGHFKTGDIRKISAKVYKDIKEKSKDYVFSVCGELLEQRKIYDSRSRPKFEINDESEKLLTAFKGRGFIYNYEEVQKRRDITK